MKQTTYLAIRTAQTGSNGQGIDDKVAYTRDRANGQAVAIGSHWDDPANPHPTLNRIHNIGASNQELFSQRGAGLVMAHGQGGAEIREGQAPCLTCNHEAPIFFAPRSPDGHARIMGNVCETLNTAQGGQRTPCVLTAQTQYGDKADTLTARHDSSPCADRGANVVTTSECCHQAGGDMRGINLLPERAHTLQAGQQQSVIFAQNQEGELRTSHIANTVTTSGNATARGTGKQLSSSIVRRLTPSECEKLQAFPEGWTQIPYRGKPAEQCPDGPRYKALGNSWAVCCARWIFERIAKVDAL